MYREATTEMQLADLTGRSPRRKVTVEAGSCWCSTRSARSRTPATAAAWSYKPIKDTTFNAFLDWLQSSAPPATTVKTVRQVMRGG